MTIAHVIFIMAFVYKICSLSSLFNDLLENSLRKFFINLESLKKLSQYDEPEYNEQQNETTKNEEHNFEMNKHIKKGKNETKNARLIFNKKSSS